ncbi:class I SAM-dependent methyltransferase [Turicimonas muris]
MHPDQLTLATIMQNVGMKNVSWTNLTFGITALHIGYKEKS